MTEVSFREAITDTFIERIKYLEGICIKCWGEIHQGEEFRGSIDHFLWDYSEVILLAALILEARGEVFISYDSLDEDDERTKGKERITFEVNSNDTFYYATADSTSISGKDLYLNFVRDYRGDKYAFLKYACQARSEDPLPPLKAKMDQFYKENPEMLLPMPCTLTDQ